jgi:hypothetical protein
MLCFNCGCIGANVLSASDICLKVFDRVISQFAMHRCEIENHVRRAYLRLFDWIADISTKKGHPSICKRTLQPFRVASLAGRVEINQNHLAVRISLEQTL